MSEGQPDTGGGAEFKVAIQAKVLHGILWEARQHFRNVKELAEHLGISHSFLCNCINLSYLPGRLWMTKHEMMLVKLQILLRRDDLDWDDVFPQKLKRKDFLDLPKERTFFKDMTVEELQEIGSVRDPLLMAPEVGLLQKEVSTLINSDLDKVLPDRERRVIKLRFGLDGEDEHTLDEVANILGVTKERVRQIESKALRKLRYPHRKSYHILKSLQ